MWALLAKEAVTLGECRVAAEYLAAAQRHNDAFQDRDNMIRYAEILPQRLARAPDGVVKV